MKKYVCCCECGQEIKTMPLGTPVNKVKCRDCYGIDYYKKRSKPIWQSIGGGDFERQAYHGTLEAIA